MAQIIDDTARLRELDRYSTLDELGDGAFDDITALVARFFKMPIAIVSLVHGDRVWFKSVYGLRDVRQAARDPGLCRTAVLAAEVSLAADPDAIAWETVANDNGFRFSAAAPLRSLHGHHLGMLCVIDTVPRTFSREDEQMLARFGRLVTVQMEQRLATRELADLVHERGRSNSVLSHASTVDVGTGLPNRGAIHCELAALCAMPADAQQFATLLFDVDHLQTVNDIYGQPGGDAVLIEVAARIEATVRQGDHVGRFGGGAFLVILVDCDRNAAASIAERVRQAVERVPIRYRGHDICITISAGVSVAAGKIDTGTVLKLTDDALYAAKREGRNRVVFSRTRADAATVNA